MTEPEAYEMLGWPRAGQPLFFILPISGSTRKDWIAYVCPNGCYQGISVPEAFAQGELEKCPRCGMPWIKLGNKEEL